MKDKINYKKGYTLLFSIIVASVVLSIAAFILSISRKQFILSSVSRDSTMAIYAADSAIQCAIQSYLDFKLATSSLPSGQTEPVPTNAILNCNGQLAPSPYGLVSLGENLASYNLANREGLEAYATTDSLGFFNELNNSCALIKVIQGYDQDNNNQRKTIIEARGYSDSNSLPCAFGGSLNPRNVERAIRLIYND